MRADEDISAVDEHLGYWLRLVSNQVSNVFKAKLEAEGVTETEWVIMRHLFRPVGGPMSPAQLSDSLGMSRGTTSKLLDRLRAKRYIERLYSEDDRRAQSVFLTALGRKIVPKLAQLADESDHEFFGFLTVEERSQLLELLTTTVRRHGWNNVPID